MIDPHARRQVHRTDAGMTLTELLVAGLVASIVLGALGTMFAGGLRASSRASASIAATAEARAALDTVSRRLRGAIRPAAGQPIFTVAKGSSVTFTASLSDPGSTVDPAPSTVSYAVDGARNCLLETITPPSGPPRSACLAFGTLTPTFRFYQVAKRPTLERPSPTPVPTTAMVLGSEGLSSADAVVVGAVEVSLAVRDRRAPAGTQPVVLHTRVLLDNDLNEVPVS